MTPSTFIKLTEAVDLDAEQRDRDAETHIMNDATDCQYHVDSGEVKTLNNISMRTFVSRVRSRDPEIWGSISLNGRPVRYIDGRFECGRHTLWINQPTNWHPIAPILMSPRRCKVLSGGDWRRARPFFGTMTEAVDLGELEALAEGDGQPGFDVPPDAASNVGDDMAPPVGDWYVDLHGLSGSGSYGPYDSQQDAMVDIMAHLRSIGESPFHQTDAMVMSDSVTATVTMTPQCPAAGRSISVDTDDFAIGTNRPATPPDAGPLPGDEWKSQ